MTGSEQDASRYCDTIIIGAGISGLACAAKLLDHSSYQKQKTLLVLEARDRVGGRIQSVHINGNRLDIGANWIHGIGTEDDPNPLVEILPDKIFKQLVCSVSFRASPTNKTSSSKAIIESQADHGWVRIDSDPSIPSYPEKKRDLVIPSEISTRIFSSIWNLIGSLHERGEKTTPGTGKQTSILQAIGKDQGFKTAFGSLPEEYHQTLRCLPQFVELMEAAPLEAGSAEHPVDNPGMGLLEFAIEDFDGEQVFLCDGYTAVVEELGKKVIQQGYVDLGVEVHSIVWDADPIVISTNSGVYTAKRVICTLPLGLLQHHIRPPTPNSEITKFFVPALPQEKSEAITSLGYGTLDKIFLIYSKPWWQDEPYLSILKKGFTINPMTGDADGTSSDPKEPSEPDSLWGFTDELPGIEVDADGNTHPGPRVISVVNLHALTGFPVLSSFVSCANAVHVEGLSDHAASMIVHRALTRWLGREPPLPEAVHVTRWASDEYSRGSYSHMITGLSETRHRATFAEPIVNADGAELRFAGEHTSVNHFATVHGALLSGWREADAVLASEAQSRG